MSGSNGEVVDMSKHFLRIRLSSCHHRGLIAVRVAKDKVSKDRTEAGRGVNAMLQFLDFQDFQVGFHISPTTPGLREKGLRLS